MIGENFIEEHNRISKKIQVARMSLATLEGELADLQKNCPHARAVTRKFIHIQTICTDCGKGTITQVDE